MSTTPVQRARPLLCRDDQVRAYFSFCPWCGWHGPYSDTEEESNADGRIHDAWHEEHGE